MPPSAPDYLHRLQTHANNPLTWDWEATLERSYRRLLRPGANIIDIGGHSGRHTRVFLDTLGAGHVWVFEPLPQAFAWLHTQFAAHPNVTLIQAAVSNQNGRTRFVINHSAPEESGLRRRRYNNEAEPQLEHIDVELTRLDDHLHGRWSMPWIDFIKIDIEGAEIDALNGAAQLIARDRPLISVEFGEPSYSAYQQRPEDLYTLAQRHDYRLTDLLGHPMESRDQWLACVDRYYWDYLMIPRERLDSVQTALADLQWPVEAHA